MLASCLALAAPASAQNSAQNTAQGSVQGIPSGAVPAWLSGTFTIDPYHSFTTFEWNHFNLSTGRGRFNKTEGTIEVAPDARTAKINVVIDVASVDTGVDLLDKRLKEPAFFNVEKFPTITFTSDNLAFDGAALKSVTGKLTIKGITRPVTLQVERASCREERNPTLKYPVCAADAMLVLNRTDFDMGFFTPLVGDRMVIRIAVEGLKGGEEAIQAQFQGFKR
ncbi:YceI family protein [Polymorphobacter sp.]|uniref:YceI family protein n=1 Tax=Polymorphobacter sp. TaxID=1909290 RepID=UPI003F6F9D0A